MADARARAGEGKARDQALFSGPEADGRSTMFSLIVTVKRGSAASLAATWAAYPTLEAARAGARLLMREERVAHVMIVRDEVPPAYVEWSA